jgi:ABC-2 type transport system permease protein
MNVIELQQVPYPFFVDVRQNGMTQDSPIVANLPAITLHWASPIELDEAKNEGREVATLIQSTDQAWLTTSTNSQPDPDLYPELGFPIEGEQSAHVLAVSIRGAFDSFFTDVPSPFETEPEPTTAEDAAAAAQRPLSKIESSPESSRLVVIGSAEFLDDTMLGLSQRSSQDRYLNNLQFLQNAVDWAVEDQDLLAIRSRGTYARLLNPLTEERRSFWELLNYAVALIGLIALAVIWNNWQRNEEPLLGAQGMGEDE